MKPLVITSKIILDALSVKHSKDVFVSECKTGASYSGCVRMDAWAMKKSWASPQVIVYEIKISRSDFLNDAKWQSYLPYCNEFYFVCPSKLIEVNEVPEDAGLLYISSTGTRLYTKKKARYRDVTIPEDLYRYLLMWRTITTREYSFDRLSKREYWKNWLEQRKIDTLLGYEVSKGLKKAINEKIEKVQRINKALEERLDRYKYLIEFLESIDVDPKTHYLRSSVESKLRELKLLIPDNLKRSITQTRGDLDILIEKLEKLEKKEGSE